MGKYEFYEIRSKKSLEYINGLRKISLVCGNYNDLHCFIWLNEDEELKHFQFLFDEKLIEWFSKQDRLITSETNRRGNETSQVGIHKGARTIHAIEDDTLMKEGIEKIKQSLFPFKYNQMIKSIISNRSFRG